MNRDELKLREYAPDNRISAILLGDLRRIMAELDAKDREIEELRNALRGLLRMFKDDGCNMQYFRKYSKLVKGEK